MLKLIAVYGIYYLKEFYRNPAALFFTLVFPALLLILFASNVQDEVIKLLTYAVYCNFAVQTVMLQGLGIALSAENESAWLLLTQTLPASNKSAYIARIVTSVFVSSISLALVTLVNLLYFHAAVTATQQGLIWLVALLGGIPMGLLAILISYALGAKTARAVFIMLNTLLLFGAFVMPKTRLLIGLANVVISKQWILASSALLLHQSIWPHFFWLFSYSLFFVLLIGLTQKVRY